MRKLLSVFISTLIGGTIFAGGVVTNTNQSASWVRLPSRNASTEVDAAYFNPAGLMKLENGFHLSLSNQTIFQKREIQNSYAGPGGAFGLNEHTYTGDVAAPLFPSAFAVYKMDKVAFSLGFGPVGGGGGATYDKGLPSFEMGISDLVPALATQGATGYSADIYFEGTSVFLGFQGAISYKINDMISIAAGARYVTAKNTYKGHLQDVMLNIAGNWLPASTYFLGLATSMTDFIGVPDELAPALPTYGGLTLAQAEGGGLLTSEQRAGIEQGLLNLVGLNQATIDAMTLTQISGTITTATPAITPEIAKATATSTLTSNKTADVEQTGTGITPFFSLNISPTDNLNIAVKYEMATKLELTNNTKQDLLVGYTATGTPITQFPDGEKIRNDMPAMLTVGLEYRLSEKLKLALGGDYFFDKSADYGHTVDADLNPATPPVHIDNSDIIKDNGLSVHGGLELTLSDRCLISAGYIYSNQGVNSLYQSDLTYGLASQTFGAGGAIAITDNIKVNLGASYTQYMKDTKTIDHILSGTTTDITATESYKKNAIIFGAGIDLNF